MLYNIAQVNLVKAKYPLDDPRMKDFVDQLPSINAEGEKSPGFVWILKDETETAVNIKLFDDPRILVNMTVWESIEALKDFVYKGNHLKAFMRRKEWFEPMEKTHLGMWWIKKGEIPSKEDARTKMEYLWANGPSQEVFTFGKIFPPMT